MGASAGQTSSPSETSGTSGTSKKEEDRAARRPGGARPGPAPLLTAWRRQRRRSRPLLFGVAGLLALGLPTPAASDWLVLEPGGEGAVAFTLGATLHEVEGTLGPVGGRIRFDPRGGEAGGTLVVDTRSARTGNGTRDRKMHEEVLASETHPEARYRVQRLEVLERSEDRARVRLAGELALREARRPLAFEATVRRAEAPDDPDAPGQPVVIEAAFPLRYVDWGLPDVSNFVLRVDDTVQVRLDLRGRWIQGDEAPEPPVAAATPPAPGEAP